MTPALAPSHSLGPHPLVARTSIVDTFAYNAFYALHLIAVVVAFAPIVVDITAAGRGRAGVTATCWLWGKTDLCGWSTICTFRTCEAVPCFGPACTF